MMLRPATNASWDLYQAAHLLNRAGFGGTPDEIKALCELGRPAAIDQLLTAPPAPAEPPPLVSERGALRDLMMSGADEEERKMKQREIRQQAVADLRSLRAWWVGRMAAAPSAALEKATLFWHGHFATSIQKVKDVVLMERQNTTLREHAFGHFGTLVKAISRDPAMMIWLDLQRSGKELPNENFAREVMELFTLGVGHYREEDIKESARAFTGYRINRQDGTFNFAKGQHDAGTKTFMGKTGDLSGDDILDAILAQPACATFLCRKLWTFYACENPEPATVDALAAVLRDHRYELRPTLAAMFGAAEFYSPAAVRSQIKSPAQLVVQTWRTLQCDPAGSLAMQQIISGLGQNLFAPPSVKGWDGNRNWINTATLTARNQFADVLLAPRKRSFPRLEAAGMLPPPVDLAQVIPEALREKPDALVDYLAFRVFQTPLDPQKKAEFLGFLQEPGSQGEPRQPRDLLAHMMKTVEYQLV